MSYSIPPAKNISKKDPGPKLAAQLAPYLTVYDAENLTPVFTQANFRGKPRGVDRLRKVGLYTSPLWGLGAFVGFCVDVASVSTGYVAYDLITAPIVVGGIVAGGLLLASESPRVDVAAYLYEESRARLLSWLQQKHGIEARAAWRNEQRLFNSGATAPQSEADEQDLIRCLQQGETVTLLLNKTDYAYNFLRYSMTAEKRNGKFTYRVRDEKGKTIPTDPAYKPDVSKNVAVIPRRSIQPASTVATVVTKQEAKPMLSRKGRTLRVEADLLLGRMPSSLGIEQQHVVDRARSTLAEADALSRRLSETPYSVQRSGLANLDRVLSGVVADLDEVLTAEAEATRRATEALADYVDSTRNAGSLNLR